MKNSYELNEFWTSKNFLLVQNEWSRGVPAISKHLRNIFESEELVKKISYFHFENDHWR